MGCGLLPELTGCGAFLLLPHHTEKASSHILRKNDACQFGLWRGAFDEPLKFGTWPSHRDRGLSAGWSPKALIASLLYQTFQLLRVIGLSLAGLLCRNLQCYRKELILIGFDVRV